jgi:hypothetical protein
MLNKRKVYVASSWRNELQPVIVKALRTALHEVYDFHCPEPGNAGFHWSEIDPDWKDWDRYQFVAGIRHPIADKGFKFDRDALNWCDTCVLLLPCGRSAHLEAGYAAGQGKRTIVMLTSDNFEPELMYRLGHGFVKSIKGLLYALDMTDSNYTVMI